MGRGRRGEFQEDFGWDADEGDIRGSWRRRGDDGECEGEGRGDTLIDYRYSFM